MSTEIDRLHHVGLIVHDLDQALGVYRRLGFELTLPTVPTLAMREAEAPRPVGAANTHAELRSGFIELLALAGPDQRLGPATPVALQIPEAARPQVLASIARTLARLGASLDRFAGLHILVFQTTDPVATAQRLSAEQVGHGGVLTVPRQIETLDGPQGVPIHLIELDGEGVPEGRLAMAGPLPVAAHASQCHVVHPNGALDLGEALLCVADQDLDGVVQRYQRYLGRPARRDGPLRVFLLDGGRFTVLPVSHLSIHLPGEQSPPVPAFVAYVVRVTDLEATRAWLRAQGVPVRSTAAGEPFVPAVAALGAAVVFRPAEG